MSEKANVRERPILMSGPMVRAILDGRKTQTRRVVQPQPDPAGNPVEIWWPGGLAWPGDLYQNVTPPWTRSVGAKRGATRGRLEFDRLWVRESWAPSLRGVDGQDGFERLITFGADGVQRAVLPGDHAQFDQIEQRGYHWRSPIHMPRWASRLTLDITGIRLERVQDISEADAKAEGVQLPVAPVSETHGAPCLRLTGPLDPTDFKAGTLEDWSVADLWRFEFASLWESLNAKRGYSWVSNPWVWVIDFRAAPPQGGEGG